MTAQDGVLQPTNLACPHGSNGQLSPNILKVMVTRGGEVRASLLGYYNKQCASCI